MAPEKVENIYVKFPYIEECFLHGDSYKEFAVCIISVNTEQILKFAVEHGVNTNVPLEDLFRS